MMGEGATAAAAFNWCPGVPSGAPVCPMGLKGQVAKYAFLGPKSSGTFRGQGSSCPTP